MWLSVCTWVCAGVYVFPGRTRALNEARPATRYIPPVWLALRRLIKTGLVHGSNTDSTPTPPAIPIILWVFEESFLTSQYFLPSVFHSLPSSLSLLSCFFFFVFHHKCFSLFLTFASLILSLTTTATQAHKHNCLHFSNTTPSALLTFRVVKNPFSQCWAFDNVASVSLAEKNAEKSVRWSWDGVRGGKKTTKKGKQCSAP